MIFDDFCSLKEAIFNDFYFCFWEKITIFVWFRMHGTIVSIVLTFVGDFSWLALDGRGRRH